VTWTMPQLLLILCLGFAFLGMASPRSSPMAEASVLILSAHYLVIHSICWSAFIMTATGSGGEDILRFPGSPFLPAASFYLGVVTILSVVCAWISVLRGPLRFARRQVRAFSAASLVFLVGLVISTWTPIAYQALIDSIPTSWAPIGVRLWAP